MLRAGVVLVAGVFLGTGFGGCLAEATWSGPDLQVPQYRTIAPREAVWAVEAWPQEDGELPVYRTERACCTAADLLRAAHGLGIKPAPMELDWPDHVAVGDEAARISVGLDDGLVSAQWDRGHGRAAPEADAVIGRARGVLEDAGLWPDEGRLRPGEPRVSAGQSQGTIDIVNGTAVTIVTERRVSYGALLDGRPVSGFPRLAVGFGAGGALVRVSVLWPDLEPAGSVALLDPDEVPRLFEERKGVVEGDPLCGSYRFDKAELVYFVGAPGWEQEWAFPAYRVLGTCAEDETQRVSFVVSAVRGAH